MRVGLVTLVSGMVAVAACGGRYQVGSHADDAGGSGSAASGSAGAPAGGATTAGSTSVAGSVTAGSAGGPADVCEQQKQDYAVEREQVIAQFADFSCDNSMDCVVSYDPSNCGRDCGYLIVTAAGRGVIDRLVTLGQRTCTGSCVTNEVNCPASPAASCVMGRCVLNAR